MATKKINTSGIEGFDAMTAEEKVAALLAYEYNDHEEDANKYKNALDKANSENKQKKDAMSESEKKIADLQKTVDDLMRKDKIATAINSFMGNGMDKETATKAATAFHDGDMTAFGEALATYKTSVAESTKNEMLRGTPRPGAQKPGAGNGNIDYAKAIDEAMARGDVVEAMRLTHEQDGSAE